MKITRRDIFTIKIVELENGEYWGDTYDQEGIPLCSSEGRSALEVMIDLAHRTYDREEAK